MMLTTRDLNVQLNLERSSALRKNREKTIREIQQDNWNELKMISTDKTNQVQLKIAGDPLYMELKKSQGDAFFDGANGFGDSFFQRVVVKYLSNRFRTVYLHTPCPDIYWDLPRIRFVERGEHVWLRTQAKCANKMSRALYYEKPRAIPSFWYSFCPVREVKHCAAWIIRTRLGIKEEDFDFEFPVRPSWLEAARQIIKSLNMGAKKLCIIRPPTLRSEWNYPTRNPKPEYMQFLIDRYKKEYYFVSIADLEEETEWLDGRLTGVDLELHHGELSAPIIFALMKLSDIVITCPAFFMIAGIAVRAKTFAIFGGCSSPYASIEESMGLANFSYATPSPSCNCFLPRHDCNKEIPKKELIEQFEELRARDGRGGDGK